MPVRQTAKSPAGTGLFDQLPLERLHQLLSSVEDEELTQLENTKAPTEAQLPGMTKLTFGAPGFDLLSTVEGGSIIEALDLAADLTDGIQQICTRFSEAVDEGEVIYLAELRSVAMLAEVASAFVRATERGLRSAGGA